MTTHAHDFGPLAQITKLEQIIDDACCARGHILDNVEKWASQSDDAMTVRLRRTYTRQALRETRYRLTGSRGKPRNEDEAEKRATSTSRVFDFIVKTCSEGGLVNAHGYAKAGLGYHVRSLSEEQIASATGVSPRHIRRILDDLDEKHKLIVRVRRSGKTTLYGVSLPETGAYQDALLTTFEVRTPRLQKAVAQEAIAIMMEGALSGFSSLPEYAS
jgi:predicted  nucleic acid-binding Zn-ribbon protein